MRRSRSARALLACLIVAVSPSLAGCGGEGPPGLPDPPVERITVGPSAVELAPGETAVLTAEVVQPDEIREPEITWTSGDAGVATVRSTGERTAEVTGRGTGDTFVTATLTGANIQTDASSASVEVRR